MVANQGQTEAVARQWIGGEWRDSAQHSDSIDPATGNRIGRYAIGGTQEADDAIAAVL